MSVHLLHRPAAAPPWYLRLALPWLAAWVRRTVERARPSSAPVASLGFARLPRYFADDTPARARVVVTDRLPLPPFPSLGLARLQAFRAGEYSGLTLEDLCFVVPARARDEALYLHELVHVVQWSHLGARRFLAAYAAGLVEHGYEGCALEAMAYAHQARFEARRAPHDVAAETRAALDRLYGVAPAPRR